MGNTLTKYPQASLRELWHIALPLMLSSASGTLMFFLDRLILASYSREALDAAVAAGMGCFLFHFGAISIASIAEVLVGQHNGAKRYHKLAEPVWQMIWFSIAITFIFFLLAFYGDGILVPKEYQDSGRGYYRWLMMSGPLFAMFAALSSFFVGKGSVKIITFSVLFGNICNFFLDILLVFGYKDIIPSLGVDGAAIATLISEVIQIAILLVLFLNKHNREKYNTAVARFKYSVFAKCFKIAWPNALGHMLEMGAWTVVMHILASVGEDYITVFAVGQSFLVLFIFAIEGLQKGVIAVASNLIGSFNIDKIFKLVISAGKLHIIFTCLLMIPIFIFPDFLVTKFLYAAHNSPEVITPVIVNAAKFSLVCLWIYFFFDGCVWIVAGIFTSSGQTLFVLFANVINAWLFSITPLVILWKLGKLELTTSWQLSIVYGAVNMLTFIWRYKTGTWKQNKVELDEKGIN